MEIGDGLRYDEWLIEIMWSTFSSSNSPLTYFARYLLSYSYICYSFLNALQSGLDLGERYQAGGKLMHLPCKPSLLLV